MLKIRTHFGEKNLMNKKGFIIFIRFKETVA